MITGGTETDATFPHDASFQVATLLRCPYGGMLWQRVMWNTQFLLDSILIAQLN
jgi:hypothetical protein